MHLLLWKVGASLLSTSHTEYNNKEDFCDFVSIYIYNFRVVRIENKKEGMEFTPLIPKTTPVKGAQFYRVGLIKGTTPQHLTYLLWGQIVLGLCFFINALILYVVASYGIDWLSNIDPVQTFLVSQEFFEKRTAYAHPSVATSDDFEFSIYKVQCTNASGIPIPFPLKNHKYAAIAMDCDPPDNLCLKATCSENYICETSLKDGATCSSDTDCFTNSTFPGIPGYKYRCELSNCSCVAMHTRFRLSTNPT